MLQWHRRAHAQAQAQAQVHAHTHLRVHSSVLRSGIQPPDNNAVAKAASATMLQILRIYRAQLTDNMPPNCRFQPSCSKYMIEAITTFGAWRGFILSSWRLFRCNPTGGSGYDPVQWPPVPYSAGT